MASRRSRRNGGCSYPFSAAEDGSNRCCFWLTLLNLHRPRKIQQAVGLHHPLDNEISTMKTESTAAAHSAAKTTTSHALQLRMPEAYSNCRNDQALTFMNHVDFG